jgi:mannose-6-phosphate isomerase-like protein (cupin superfamily)
MTYKIFKDRQLSDHSNYEDTKRGKRDLENELNGLNKKLNQLLHKQASGLKYDTWLKTHQPFHWFAEYYEIFEGNGGFDVVIGNPPYVAMKDVKYIPKTTRHCLW